MRLTKLLLLAAVAVFGPGSCLNSPLPPRDLESGLSMTPLSDAPHEGTEVAPGIRWIEGWQLASPNYHFGGYSAAVIRRDGKLMLGSDRGRLLVFEPDREGAANARFDWLHATADADKHMPDLEALTLDPATGNVWAAFEGRNMILKLGEDEKLLAHATPAAIARWKSNFGPEAFARLPDGRFVAISESATRWFGSRHRGVLFSGDPTGGAEAKRFMLDVPDGFLPVDLAALPDGRALLLLRKLSPGLPPRFESALLLLDLAEIGEEAVLRGSLLRFNDALPPENYEGLAFASAPDGSITLWMVSDDNLTHFQRTLLVEMSLELPDSTKEKARGAAARLSKSGIAPR